MDEEQKETQQTNEMNVKLAKLVLGKDDSATSEVLGYRFKYHAPSMLEQLQIQVESNNLRMGALQSDLDLKILTTMIATFDVLCSEIVKIKDEEGRDINPIEIQTIKDSSGKSIRNQKFWEFLQSRKNPKLFSELLIPLYDNFLTFQNETSLKYSDLKN